MNVRTVLFLVLGLFLLFLMIGGDVFMGLQRQQSFNRMNLEEEPEHIRRIRDTEPKYPYMAPMRLGDSYVESRYQDAMETMRAEERRSEFLRQERRSLSDFLQSESGQLFARAVELMKLGRMEQARRNIHEALSAHSDYDYALYVVFIKKLIRTHLSGQDLKDVDQAVLNYLEVIKNQHSADAYQRAVRDFSDAVQAKVLRSSP